jgi:hypothetical protein
MIRVSGVLRKMLTQAVPKPRSTGTGDTRIAARTTPITSANAVETRVSRRIHQNPDTYRSKFAES